MARNKYDVDEVVEQKFDIKQLKRLVDYIRLIRGKCFLYSCLCFHHQDLECFL